jgi:hypothetical protein
MVLGMTWYPVIVRFSYLRLVKTLKIPKKELLSVYLSEVNLVNLQGSILIDLR